MTVEKKKYINMMYEEIINEISISDNMQNKAISSYNAVGKWLAECDPDLDVKILPQGSFNLGTVIKPISDEDDYDIDLVCLLKNGYNLKAYEIKNIVGRRLKEHCLYQQMLDKEGKRCWTLIYKEFHMDVLPAVPKNKLYVDLVDTEIRLTHKIDEGRYVDKYSNPSKYKTWFEDRMKTVLNESKEIYARANNIDIENVPTYKLKTPLQKAIQLMKRHRDIMFKDDKENVAPISIIITTLAALAYNDEKNVYDALQRILNHMTDYIKKDNTGAYWICNPVMENENFADKWNIEPKKSKAFFKWLEKAKKDLIDDLIISENKLIDSQILKRSFGENVVKKAYNKIGDNLKEARDIKKLYVNGLVGGITTASSRNTVEVKGHTFYGQ